ncbi:MAG: SDR family oxidoreductase [Planctomycetia bacterium]|nr:SDR family oxidoreductase [Planctomycetia bacterium]
MNTAPTGKTRSESPVCVVTGGSGGIGLATAKKFASLGYRIATCGRRAEKLAAAAREISAVAPDCVSLVLDVAQADAVPQLVALAEERFGRVDVLVNNAGHAPRAAIDKTSQADFDQSIAINLAAVFHGTRAVWPLMARQKSGVIVNISSVASLDPFPGFAVYGPCKAWVNLFSRITAEEGKAAGIRVYSVAPGAVETPLLRGVFPHYPAEQCLSPEDVAEVIAAVCQEPLRHCTGQTIVVRK